MRTIGQLRVLKIKLNTLSRSACQLGRKQEHFRWIGKLTLQLLREWRLIVFGKTFVVNFGAKILGQLDNLSYARDNKCNSEYGR